MIQKVKNNPNTGLETPGGFQAVRVPRFQDNRHWMVVLHGRQYF